MITTKAFSVTDDLNLIETCAKALCRHQGKPFNEWCSCIDDVRAVLRSAASYEPSVVQPTQLAFSMLLDDIRRSIPKGSERDLLCGCWISQRAWGIARKNDEKQAQEQPAGEWTDADYDVAHTAAWTRENRVSLNDVKRALDAVKHRLQPQQLAGEPERVDAVRYRRLRVLGCAPFGSKHLEQALVLRFTNLDAFVDAGISEHTPHGEATCSPYGESTFVESLAERYRALEAALEQANDRADENEHALREIALALSVGGFNDVGLVPFDPGAYLRKILEGCVDMPTHRIAEAEITQLRSELARAKERVKELERERDEAIDHIAMLSRRHEEDLAWQQRAQDAESELTQLRADLTRAKEQAASPLLSLTSHDWDGIAEATARHSGARSWTGGNSHYWGVRQWMLAERGIDDTWETRQKLRAAGHEREDAAYVRTALAAADEKVIVATKVVLAPGAGIKITALELSEAAKEALMTEGAIIESDRTPDVLRPLSDAEHTAAERLTCDQIREALEKGQRDMNKIRARNARAWITTLFDHMWPK